MPGSLGWGTINMCVCVRAHARVCVVVCACVRVCVRARVRVCLCVCNKQPQPSNQNPATEPTGPTSKPDVLRDDDHVAWHEVFGAHLREPLGAPVRACLPQGRAGGASAPTRARGRD